MVISWVCVLQKGDGGFSDGVGLGRGRVEATSDAVACLQLLGEFACIDRAAALRFVSCALAKLAKTVDETCWAVYAHCSLGGFGCAMATPARSWCLAWAPWLLRLSPKRHPGPLRKALRVMGQLPQTRDEVLGRVAGLLRACDRQIVMEYRQH